MNKENVLFSICGFLLGVIVGTLLIAPRLDDIRAFAGVPAAVPASSNASLLQTKEPVAADPAIVEMFTLQVANLKKQLELDPADSDAAVQLGNLYMDAGKYGDAVSYYRVALKRQRDANVATDLGICLRATGEHEQALQTFREAQLIDPRHWQAVFNEAVVLVDLQRPDEARLVVMRLKTLRPDDEQVARFEQILNQIK